ncbi:hypothetical protein GCM10027425_05530 [Alteromonas gracilis]
MDEIARRQGAASMGLIAVSLALVALGAWGRLDPQGFVWVDRLFDHPVLFGVLALMLTAWGLVRLTIRRWVQVSLWVAAACAVGLWVLVGSVLGELLGKGQVVAIEPAPDASYLVVVRSTSAGFVDPAWDVAIRQTSGLTAREFEIGCIDGDDPRHTFQDVRWVGPDVLQVRTSGHAAMVRVDPVTGEPGPVRGPIWSC